MPELISLLTLAIVTKLNEDGKAPSVNFDNELAEEVDLAVGELTRGILFSGCMIDCYIMNVSFVTRYGRNFVMRCCKLDILVLPSLFEELRYQGSW